VSDDHFLSRWSRRKHAASRGEVAEKPAPAAMPPAQSQGEATGQVAAPEALPPVESLTPESDFTPFMKPEVDPQMKRAALRTLFRDPRFNVMDGLDVYIDDYSKPDPIPPEWLGQLNQLARLGDFKPHEAENDADAEKADAAPQIPQEPEQQQVLEASTPEGSAPAEHIEETPPEVGPT